MTLIPRSILSLAPTPRCVAALALWSLILATNANASQGPTRNLKSLSADATLAFAGTVGGITYRKIGTLVVTDVRFSALNFAIGPSEEKGLTLTLYGGKMDGKVFFANGVPSFEVGERCFIFAADRGSDANWYLPIVGMGQGVFRIKQVPRMGTPVVHDVSGRPLVRVDGQHVAILAEAGARVSSSPRAPEIVREYGIGATGPEKREPAREIYPNELDPGTRVTEGEFIRAVRRVVSEKD